MSFIYEIKTYYIDLVRGKRKGALKALFSFLLLLFSFIYGFFVKLILSCYQTELLKSYKPDCQVISIGNITWGGTGKTPLVETLARFLRQQGRRPAILMRGYGKDEVYMLKDKLQDIPVLVGNNRIKSAREAKETHAADVIILDDGFQHWRIGRDLDIVLIDASCPFGNRRLIPRGILREPLSSLKRADVLVLTKTNFAKDIESIKQELRKYNHQAPIYEAKHLPRFLHSLTSNERVDGSTSLSINPEHSRRIELSTIRDRQIALISGIADPKSFAQTLSLLGAKISLKFYFPDHYQYSKDDLKRIERQCLEKQIKIIITTEKDATKLSPLLKSERFKVEVLTLSIELKIAREQSFFSLFKSDKNSEKSYSVLILSDGKAGHLNQSKAVARIIQQRKMQLSKGDAKISPALSTYAETLRSSRAEVNTKIAEVKFKNGFCRAFLALCSVFANSNCRRCMRCFRFCLQKDSFCELMHSPANIIVSAGSSLSSVNLFLSYKNNARSVILMKPSFLSLDRFDLVIVPEHDQVKPKANILSTRITPNLIDRQYLQKQANALLRQGYGRLSTEALAIEGPTIGVLIGGNTDKYRLTVKLMDKIVSQLKVAARNLNCQILVTTSRRTPKIVEELLKDNLANFEQCKLIVIANDKNIPEAVGGILGLSDIILVSGESISMVSEAVSAERYVLAFIPEKEVKTSTKQERFLEKLEEVGILKNIQPDNLSSEIEKIWKERPLRRKIQDRETIYQAINRIM